MDQRRIAGRADQPAGQGRLIGDGGRKTDEAAVRRQLAQAREAERQQIAALVAGQRMQFVDDRRRGRPPKMRGASA